MRADADASLVADRHCFPSDCVAPGVGPAGDVGTADDFEQRLIVADPFAEIGVYIDCADSRSPLRASNSASLI